jgi:RNA polymerase sigma-70 factor (ECF subfamily)
MADRTGRSSAHSMRAVWNGCLVHQPGRGADGDGDCSRGRSGPSQAAIESLAEAGRIASRAAELYRQLKPRVSRVARSLLGESPSAELVHDVSADTVLSMARYRGDCAFDSWLYAVAIRHVRKWIRAERRRRCLLRDARGSVPTFHPCAPDEAAGAHGMAGRFQDALGGLPDRQRTCLVMVHLEGVSPAAVGKRLGITPDAVRMNIHRARGRLRSRLLTD